MRDRIFPVILCGGVGARLWPASNASTPKQFVRLVGDESSFQDAVGRAASLTGVQRIVVVASAAHEGLIQDQLAAIGQDAHLILEPEGRESGPAIAAAANWVHAQDDGAIAIFSAADHLLPDRTAYADAIEAAVEAAATGQIVMMGATPTGPSEAYGYVKPVEGGEGRVRKVDRFVEKPSAALARQYLEAGFLWNAGNFVIAVATLVEELAALCPDVQAAAVAGLAGAESRPGVTVLGSAFRQAPKIAFDHAVLEKTRRAAVVQVDFVWSDLGAWDAVWAASDKDGDGNSLGGGAEALESANVLVRADAGVQVAVIGLSNVAVIVKDGAVLVCALSESQQVKTVAARMAERS